MNNLNQFREGLCQYWPFLIPKPIYSYQLYPPSFCYTNPINPYTAFFSPKIRQIKLNQQQKQQNNEPSRVKNQVKTKEQQITASNKHILKKETNKIAKKISKKRPIHRNAKVNRKENKKCKKLRRSPRKHSRKNYKALQEIPRKNKKNKQAKICKKQQQTICQYAEIPQLITDVFQLSNLILKKRQDLMLRRTNFLESTGCS